MGHGETLHSPGWQSERQNVKQGVKSVSVECSCGWNFGPQSWICHAERAHARHWIEMDRLDRKQQKEDWDSLPRGTEASIRAREEGTIPARWRHLFYRDSEQAK